MSYVKIGVAGPVGSGKTALIEALSRKMAKDYSIGVITNDIYTKEDAQFLAKNSVLPVERIIGVETGGCPHTAIREDASMNLEAVDEMMERFPDIELLFIESGGDNLSATFSPELVDATIFVIDVAEGDKIPRKGGPGITRSDLLVINKIDLAPYVGRTERELPERQAKEILENGSYGVLALAGDGGYPYAVPLNYVYDGERIYFHCAAEGHKIDAIARDNKCSFCVVENGGVIEDRFTTKYRSVIAFGKIYEETDGERRENAFRLMMRSLTPSVTNEKREEMSHCQKARILAMDIEYLSSKGANQ